MGQRRALGGEGPQAPALGPGGREQIRHGGQLTPRQRVGRPAQRDPHHPERQRRHRDGLVELVEQLVDGGEATGTVERAQPRLDRQDDQVGSTGAPRELEGARRPFVDVPGVRAADGSDEAAGGEPDHLAPRRRRGLVEALGGGHEAVGGVGGVDEDDEHRGRTEQVDLLGCGQREQVERLGELDEGRRLVGRDAAAETHQRATGEELVRRAARARSGGPRRSGGGDRRRPRAPRSGPRRAARAPGPDGRGPRARRRSRRRESRAPPRRRRSASAWPRSAGCRRSATSAGSARARPPAPQVVVVAQDAQLQVAQRRSRIESELVAQHRSRPLDRGQRVRLPAGPVQGEGEQPGPALPGRVAPELGPEVGDNRDGSSTSSRRAKRSSRACSRSSCRRIASASTHGSWSRSSPSNGAPRHKASASSIVVRRRRGSAGRRWRGAAPGSGWRRPTSATTTCSRSRPGARRRRRAPPAGG